MPRCTSGKSALIDDDMYDALTQSSWNASSYGYATSTAVVDYQGKRYRRGAFMHRIVAETPDKMVTDHIDHNTFNNQRANLRVCSSANNSKNMRRHRDNKLRYKGVFKQTLSDTYGVLIMVSGKRHYLGTYATPEIAAAWYDWGARYFHVDYAYTNTGSVSAD